jgi:putrescine transport system substrate-binding protein
MEAAQSDVLNVANFANYIDGNAIPSFEKRTGMKVNYDLNDSNDTLEAKLLVGNSGYDIVVATYDFFAKQVEAGIYQPVPKAKLKNYTNLDPALMRQLDSFDPGNTYGVPYMWGTTGVAFNVEEIHARMPDAPLDSWRMIFDPAVVSKFKSCGVALVDNGDAVVVAATIYLGLDPNSENPDDLRAAIETIARIQPFVRYFHASSYVDDLANGEVCLALGYSGDVYQAKRSAQGRLNIDYQIPKEGAAIWVDLMGIPKDAPHPEAAAKWIDHILEPAIVAGISNTIFYANPNLASSQLLNPDVRNDPIIYPSDAVRKRLVALKPKSEKFARLRIRAWTQVKAGAQAKR